MFYFRLKEYGCDYASSRVFSSDVTLEKESVVVIPDSYGTPTTATVEEKVEEYIALASDYEVEPIICVVDMKAYKKRMNAKNKRAMVLKKMQDKMQEVKLVESLKKYAEKDDVMRTLFKEYENTLKENEVREEEEF